MALRIIRACEALKSFHLLPQTNFTGYSSDLLRNSIIYPQCQLPSINSYRFGSFFNRYSAETLWKGATAVSNAGKRRGRGKSRRLIKNLNKGQLIGVGRRNMIWPGLNAPVIRGSELVEMQKLPDKPDFNENLYRLRDTHVKRFKAKLSPLERGWSGGNPAGQSIGPPDPIGEETFQGFDSKILFFKSVSVMTSNVGRKKLFRVIVITGNKNGLIGFAACKGSTARSTLTHAKNRAASRLLYINRCDNRTIYHDFYTRFGPTKIYVTKQANGYGLVCHRAIKTCCEIIGITDLHAKIEGSCNLAHIMKAFFIGLMKQRTYEQLAEDKKLHLVEFREETGSFPHVLASPAIVRKPEEIDPNEILDFTQYLMGGKVVLKKKKLLPFYCKKRSWGRRLKKTLYFRNQKNVRLRMYAEDGGLRSFYSDKYPEAKSPPMRAPKSEEIH